MTSLRTKIKKVALLLPKPARILAIRTYESFFFHKTLYRVRNELSTKDLFSAHVQNKKPRVLFYHVSGLSFGGTEKFLQIIAKHIDKNKYDAYFMYSPKPRGSSGNIRLDGRKEYVNETDIELIEFDYQAIELAYPHVVTEMKPSIFNILKERNIDLLITTGAGYSEYPFNIIRNIPIILINIFGSPAIQDNISKHISISKAVDSKIKSIIPTSKRDVIYIQSERPDPSYKAAGQELRKKFGIKETDTVFGRIGRADDGIFDPIGIMAFKSVVRNNPDAHYIVMSPPPVLIELVKTENIQNVHYCTTSAVERDVWSFHYSLDALAHFRLDGESFGLNIAESMIAGNPIITHKSHIWNGHLEYLDSAFSFVAEKDDVKKYAEHMESIIKAKKDGTIAQMKEASLRAGERLFLVENSIGKIEGLIDEAIANFK